MRSIGNKANDFPVPPDTVSTFLLAAATAQAIDYSSGATRVRLTGMTTGGAQLNFYTNIQSTLAAIPSSGTTATTGSSGVSVPVLGVRDFAVPSSTSFSVIAPTSGYVHVEQWKI